jgi:hypothetical protein
MSPCHPWGNHQLPQLQQFEIKPATKIVNFKDIKKEDD